MNNQRRYNRLITAVMVLVLGLGFAFALPLLVDNQSLAANRSFEPPQPSKCFADVNGNGYESPDASAVQVAVDEAPPGSVVKIAGECTGVNARGAMLQTVYISKSLTLEGGHTQNNWSSPPDPQNNPTILDADNGGRVVVISDTQDVKLDGLFITHGHADNGGGILSYAPFTLTNTTLYSNTAANGGGLLNFATDTMFLEEVTFLNNKADFGGGMTNFYANQTTMINVDYLENKAINGGGVFNVGSDPNMTNITFSGNSASQSGGAFANSNSSPVLINTLFSGNYAKDYGGGMYDSFGKSTLINATFSGNSASIKGGGIANLGSRTTVSNSIFWNNKDSTGTGTYTATITNDGTITLTYSLMEDSGGSGSWNLDPRYVNGGHNIDIDPMFIIPVNPDASPTPEGNLRLTQNSPAIDKGNNSLITVLFDLDNNPRRVDGDGNSILTVDMGAYEYQVPYTYDLSLPLAIR